MTYAILFGLLMVALAIYFSAEIIADAIWRQGDD